MLVMCQNLKQKHFDLMLKKFGINPKETIYIEDIAKNLSIGQQNEDVQLFG